MLSSECLLAVDGGTVTIDGVRVVRARNQNQCSLTPTKEYLIAGLREAGGRMLRTAAGADSVFEISDSRLIPLGREDRGLVREIEEVYGNDLSRIRSDIPRRQRHRN